MDKFLATLLVIVVVVVLYTTTIDGTAKNDITDVSSRISTKVESITIP